MSSFMTFFLVCFILKTYSEIQNHAFLKLGLVWFIILEVYQLNMKNFILHFFGVARKHG